MGKGKGMGISAEVREYEEMGNKTMRSRKYKRQLVGNKAGEVCEKNLTPLNSFHCYLLSTYPLPGS